MQRVVLRKMSKVGKKFVEFSRRLEENPERYNRLLNRGFFVTVLLTVGMILFFGWPAMPPEKGRGLEGNQVAANRRSEPIQPIPMHIELDAQKVELGRRLFNDTRLSRTDRVSCATCHDLQRGGVDGKPRSRGMNGRVGDINAPTVFNSGFNFSQFWDGRAATLEEQVDGPIHNPMEMGMDWKTVLRKLRASPDYRERFLVVYGRKIDRALVRDAIAEFERSLYTPNSRFDRWLRGDANALEPDELRGYALFKRYGCIACHQGIGVGGNMYQTFGVVGDYFKKRGNLTKVDLGRYNVTGKEADRYKFKVPSLRNVELTAPYLHDGTAKTLADAVNAMGRYQLGVRFQPGEVDLIVKFLKTLTGEYKGKPLKNHKNLQKTENRRNSDGGPT